MGPALEKVVNRQRQTVCLFSSALTLLLKGPANKLAKALRSGKIQLRGGIVLSGADKVLHEVVYEGDVYYIGASVDFDSSQKMFYDCVVRKGCSGVIDIVRCPL